jgi:hypothetical protein
LFSFIQPFFTICKMVRNIFFGYLPSIYVFSLDSDIKFHTHKNHIKFLKNIALKNLRAERHIRRKHMITSIQQQKCSHRKEKNQKQRTRMSRMNSNLTTEFLIRK